MSRSTATLPTACATCEGSFSGPPTLHLGLAFCCDGCAAGGPCLCSYDGAIDDVRAIRTCLDVLGALEETVADDESRLAVARR
jgi:hypothetical protein